MGPAWLVQIPIKYIGLTKLAIEEWSKAVKSLRLWILIVISSSITLLSGGYWMMQSGSGGFEAHSLLVMGIAFHIACVDLKRHRMGMLKDYKWVAFKKFWLTDYVSDAIMWPPGGPGLVTCTIECLNILYVACYSDIIAHITYKNTNCVYVAKSVIPAVHCLPWKVDRIPLSLQNVVLNYHCDQESWWAS